MYDLVTDTWEKRASVPRGLGNTGFATVGGKIYMFGGSADRVLNTTYEYDTVADKWTQKANIPAPRMLVSAGVLDGKIYLIGGDTVPGGGQPLPCLYTTRRPIPGRKVQKWKPQEEALPPLSLMEKSMRLADIQGSRGGCVSHR
jgi:hypothetical protein